MSAKPSVPSCTRWKRSSGNAKVVIGMVHSHALPSSVAYDGQSMDELVGFALVEAEQLKQGGVWWNEVDPDRLATFMAETDRVHA